MLDGEAFAADIAAAVQHHLDEVLGPVMAELKVLREAVAKAQPSPAADQLIDATVHRRVHQAMENQGADLVRAMVAEAVAAIPPARDGEDGNSVTAEDVRPLVDELVAAAVAALPAPKDGEPGKDLTAEDVRPLLAELVAAAVAEIPPAKDGEPGKSVAPEDLRPLVGELVAAAVAEIPAPRDGQDADPADIERAVAAAVAALPVPKDGEPGKSVTVEDVSPLLEDLVEAAFAAAPEPVGLAGAIIDRDHQLVVTLSDGKACPLGRVVGNDADPAEVQRQVAQAVAAERATLLAGFAELVADVELGADGRTLAFSLGVGEHVVIRKLALPIPLDQGVWRDGAYAKGDVVSFGGSGWIAQKDTDAKPGDGDAWRLFVKKGRDGRDAPQPPRAPAPVSLG